MKRMFLIIFILCISYNMYAIDCPPSSTCTATWTQIEDIHYALDANDNIWVSATISIRVNCDGDFEMILHDFKGINNDPTTDFLDKFNYLHYSFSSASEMIAIDYLTRYMPEFDFGIEEVPDCSTNTSTKRVFLYTAACGIWTRCSYKLPSPIDYVCDTGWSGNLPHYSDGGDVWVDHWKWQSCGEVCCRRVYELCRDEYVEKAGTFIKIKAMTKEKYPGSECSEQGTFWGKRQGPATGTNQELQCEDGC